MDDRSRKLVRWGLIGLGILVAVVALGLLLTEVSASPRLCAACHEMKPAVAAWRASGHANVGCEGCHEKPRAWYRFPQTLAVRSAMLGQDVLSSSANRSAWMRKSIGEYQRPVSDETCMQCHDLSRTATIRQGTLIDHKEHAKRNDSCTSCHYWTGHPDPKANRSLLMMERCFNCHGRGATAKAPGTCQTCHPKSFELQPASHKAGRWPTQHGKAATADRKSCELCHDASFCTDCHGLEMPHPAGWQDGRSASGHSAFAKTDRTVCKRCHTERPDLCTMCHHKGYEPEKGPWIAQHPEMVRQRGTVFCLDCHDPVYCVQCHSKRRPQPPGSGSSVTTSGETP